MDKTQFSAIRKRLGKTQRDMSHLLSVSLKAVQSFEQGWRNVPIHVERHLILLLQLANTRRRRAHRSCWDVKNCRPEQRSDCPAWEFDAGELCWIVNGDFCRCQLQDSWHDKLDLCKRCRVFKRLMGKDLELLTAPDA